jgi:thymidine phosphorylase
VNGIVEPCTSRDFGTTLREAFVGKCAAQGAQPPLDWSDVLKHEVRAQHSGRVQAIDGFVISGLGRCAGAPTDHLAGVDLACGLGAIVSAGDLLYVLQASDQEKLAQAAALAQSDCGYRLS